jgi:hypothetical protein
MRFAVVSFDACARVGGLKAASLARPLSGQRGITDWQSASVFASFSANAASSLERTRVLLPPQIQIHTTEDWRGAAICGERKVMMSERASEGFAPQICTLADVPDSAQRNRILAERGSPGICFFPTFRIK